MSYKRRYYDSVLRSARVGSGFTLPRDITSLIVATNGVLKTLAGPTAIYSAAAGQVPDGNGGVQDSNIPPVGEHGYYAGPAYSNALSASLVDLRNWEGPKDATVSANKITSTTSSSSSRVRQFTSLGSLGDVFRIRVASFQATGQFSIVAGANVTNFTPSVGLVVTVSSPGGGNNLFIALNPDGDSGVSTIGDYLELDQIGILSGPYLHEYIPPGQSAVSTVGTTTGNGVSIPLTPAGVEQVPDGVELTVPVFDNVGTGWVSDWDFSNGVATAPLGSTSYLVADTIQFSLGDKYRLTYTRNNTNELYLAGGSSAFGFVELSNVIGTHSIDLVVTFEGALQIYNAVNTQQPQISAVSLQKLIPLQSQADKADRLIECFRGVPDGVELVNPNPIPTGWTVDGLNFVAASTSNEIQTLTPPIAAGERILVHAVVNSLTSGSFRIILEGGAVYSDVISSLGDYVFEYVTTTSGGVYIWPQSALTADIDFSIQKLEPAQGTVAVLMKMGAGSGELSSTNISFVSSTGQYDGELWRFSGTGGIVWSFDKTQYAALNGTWSRHEYHAKVVEFNGTKFRVGNKRFNEDGTAIDADIVWSHATLAGGTTFDGSFNPTTFLHWFLNSTVPNWMRCHFVSNQAGLGDAEIIRRLRKYGKF